MRETIDPAGGGGLEDRALAGRAAASPPRTPRCRAGGRLSLFARYWSAGGWLRTLRPVIIPDTRVPPSRISVTTTAMMCITATTSSV